MAGHRNFNELRNRLSPEQKAADTNAVHDEIQQMLLSELRKLSGMTQEQLAAAMGVRQSSLSRLEGQSDIQVSTLQRLVEALGGKLELIADLPTGRIRVRLNEAA